MPKITRKYFPMFYNYHDAKPVPKGKVIVHNHVIPVEDIGYNGFRVWIDVAKPKDIEYVRCKCKWAAGTEWEAHYRVKANM